MGSQLRTKDQRRKERLCPGPLGHPPRTAVLGAVHVDQACDQRPDALDRVVMIPMPEANTRTAALLSGQVERAWRVELTEGVSSDTPVLAFAHVAGGAHGVVHLHRERVQIGKQGADLIFVLVHQRIGGVEQARGLAHALIEVRQDLILSTEGQAEWTERLAGVLRKVMREERALHAIELQARRHARVRRIAKAVRHALLHLLLHGVA